MAINSTQKAQVIIGALKGSGVNLTTSQVAKLTGSIATLYAKGKSDDYIAAYVLKKLYVKAQLSKLIKAHDPRVGVVDTDGNGKFSTAEKKAFYAHLASDLVTETQKYAPTTLTQDKTTVTEGVDAITFTVTGTPGVTLNWNVDANHVADVNNASGTVTLNAAGTAVFTVAAKADGLTEGNEQINVALTNDAGVVLGSSAPTTLVDTTVPPDPQLPAENLFTLTEVIAEPGTPAIPDSTVIYWGYDPQGNGIPVADLVNFLTTITGLDLKELGLIDADGQDPFQNVTSLTLSNPLSPTSNNSGGASQGGEIDQSTNLRITFADGTFLNAEVALGDSYFQFLNNLLFDAEGNSRLFEKTVDGTSGTGPVLAPIVLTPTQNNGGTIETGVTSADDDTIVAGRLELLHQAYIDGGAGYNILEVDAKGTYAQPLTLKNIQEVRVNDLPNFYTTYYGDPTADGNLDNTQFTDTTLNFPTPIGDGSDNSWIDLSRATDIERLVVTDGGIDDTDYPFNNHIDGNNHLPGYDSESGDLYIVGVRNAATLRLEGAFQSGTTTIQYGQGQTGTLNVELALGDVEQDINILQNAAVLNIDSQGVENHMHNFFAGGSVSRLLVKGTGVFGVDEDLNSSFNQGRPALIDASANTGGLDVTLNGHYKVTIKGTQADDEIISNGYSDSDPNQPDYQNPVISQGDVVIEAGNGNNAIQADGRNIVKITSGIGDDNISAQDGKTVVINAGEGDNVINADGAKDLDRVVTITTGSGNDTISAVRAGTVTIDAGNGNNNITAAANEITITTGTGNDKLVVSGMDVFYLNGDNTDTDNNTHDLEGISEILTPGALLNINVGAGSNTIILGRDTDGSHGPAADYGVTALEGSSITGSNIALFVENTSDLTEAALSGITKVTLKQELTITDDQFKSIGASAFSVYHAVFGATEDLHIRVDSDANLTDLLNAQALSTNVRLNFELHNGATLTLTAEQLHKYVAVGGIDGADGLNGKIIVTGAGANFDPFDNGATQLVIDGGTISAGDLYGAEDVTIIRDGTFERPVVGGLGDFLTINSDTTPVVDADVITEAQTLKITGSHNIEFKHVVDLGGEVSASGKDIVTGQSVNDVLNPGTLETDGFTVDFHTLTGTVTGLTLDHFQDVKSIVGNNTGTRIDVKLNADVGAAGVNKGLNTQGVAQYVVTSIDVDQDGDITDGGNNVIVHLCDLTKDVQVIGLHGNAGNSVTFTAVPWGLVAPSILLEGDGYANWNGGLKVDGNPDTSDIGTVNVEYFTPGAPAVININNGGVELGVTSTGTERKFLVDGINLTNAASATINVTQGDAVITEISSDSGLKTLTVTATEDVTINGELPTSLTAINASGVVGHFTATIDQPADDFTFVGSQGGSNLTLQEVLDATADTHIDGGVGGVVLTIGGDYPGDDNVDLSAATLTHVTAVVLTDGADLSLTIEQANQIGAANFSVEEGATASLHLSGLNDQPFALANFADGITVSVVDVAALPTVTLDPATDLTGIGGLLVHEGTVLNLTAAQYQQLTDNGSIVASDENGDGNIDVTVNITDLTQADVDNGFDTSGITGGINLTLTLAENVAFPDDDGATVLTNLSGVEAINVGDNLTLTLPHVEDADGVDINGGANSTLAFTDTSAGAFQSIDASGFNVDTLKILNVLVDHLNVDLLFTGLPQAVTKVIYNGQGWVEGVNQTVVIEEGTTVPGFVVFNKPEADVEIQNFTLNLNGGTEIGGNLRLSSSVKEDASGNDLIQTHLKTVTINSTGTGANLLSGKTANIIDGAITSQGTGNQVSYISVDNNLLDVTINAEQGLIVQGGIVFESVTGDDSVTANDNDEAVALLTVNGTADVNVGALNTSDSDVDGLNVVNNGTGTLSAVLDSGVIDADDALSFTGTGDIDLTIEGNVDLSDDVLTAVDQIKIDGNGELTLTQAQFNALGVANLLPDSSPATTAHLNIVELGSAPFDASALADGIVVDSVTIATGNITLDPATNLTGVQQIIVPEGSTLTLTAAQFQQLQGSGSIVGVDATGAPSTEFTVHITSLTQADVNHDENGDGDYIDAGDSFVLTGIAADNVTVALGESTVTLGTYDEDGNLLAAADLNGADVILANNQTLRLVNSDQADGLDVSGGSNTTLVFLFDNTGLPIVGNVGTIDASGFNVSTLRALNTFVDGTDVENLLVNLPSAVTLVVYQDPAELGFVSATNRVVVIEPSVTVPGFLVFNDWQDDHEVRTLSLTLSGGVEIDGNLRLSTTDKDPGLVARYFDTLTIVSQGTAENIDSHETANVIDGDITGEATFGPSRENNLLNVNINATQDFIVTQDIVFTSIDPDKTDAKLTITGSADVTVHGLDASDDDFATPGADITTLTIANNGTGTFTATGGTPAIFGDIEELVLTGTGDMAFGTDEPGAEGVTSSTLSVIDASGLSGDLDLGEVNDVDSADFTFTSGTGVTKLTLTSDTLDSTGLDAAPGTADDTAGWTFDFSSAAAGSDFHLGAGLNLVDGSVLNINMGTNGTLYIDQSYDLSGLDLSILQNQPIVLADGAILTLTAEQANGLDIIAGPDTGAAGITAKVNIIDLGDTPVDLSGIATNIAGVVTLEDNDVTLAAATDLGDFTVQLDDISGDSGSLSGQTIRFTTVDQAARAVDVVDTGTVGDSSANVVWLFTSIPGPVDTSKYDLALGRLWLNDDLINNQGGLVENLFTTLPSTILRVDFADLTQLNVLLSSNAVDRTVEFVNFTSLGNLTFSDIGATPDEYIRNLTLDLGGQATIGNIVVDDVIGGSNINPASIDFNALTINSFRAVRTGDILASEGFVNDNDGSSETKATSDLSTAPGEQNDASLVGNENTLPNNINTVGEIKVGGANGIDLDLVNINTGAVTVIGDGSGQQGAAIATGKITYDSEVAGTVVNLNVTGANNVTIAAVNTGDAQIVGIDTNTAGFTATLNAPGASPAYDVDNTEGLVFRNGGAAAGTINLGSATNAGVAGNQLSHIDASAFGGTLNLGIVAEIDSTDDLAQDFNGDGDTLDAYEGANVAFSFVSGSGVNTLTLATANGSTPQLNAGQTWSFDYTGADPGSYLEITDDVIFQPTVDPLDPTTLKLINVPLVINGNVDLSKITLDITGGSISVPAGSSLTLTIDQVDYLHAQGVFVEGSGTTYVVGDGTDHDLTINADVLNTVGVDYSGVTLDTTLPAPQDADGRFAFKVWGAVDDTNVAAVQNIVGSDYGDDIDESLNSIVGATVTGGLGDDAINSLFNGGSTTFNVDAGTDTIQGMWTNGAGTIRDVLVVSAGATTNAFVYDSSNFVATAATTNAGTANISKDPGTVSNTTIDVSLAGGPNGYNLTGSDSATSAIDTLIGSAQADVINGGNLHQTNAAAADVLTGNGGADIFAFDLDLGTAADLVAATTTAGVDRELITITADATDNGNESLTVNYMINGVLDSVLVDLTNAFDITDASAIAVAVASALNAKANIGATASTNVVTVSGDAGGNLTINSVTNGGTTDTLSGVISNGTDDKQVTTLTINGTPNPGDFYSLVADYASPLTGESADYTALPGDTANNIAAGLEGNFTDGEVTATVVGNVITFTDNGGDNGGFALGTDATAAFAGSGASDNGALDYTTADVITDFLSGVDKIDFGLQAGSGGNYLEVAEVATYSAAKAAADVAFFTNGGSLQYYLTSATDLDGAGPETNGSGLLFFDANLDGQVDGVVLLTGVTNNSFSALDIQA